MIFFDIPPNFKHHLLKKISFFLTYPLFFRYVCKTKLKKVEPFGFHSGFTETDS